jgi:glutamate--cysteine ligase
MTHFSLEQRLLALTEAGAAPTFKGIRRGIEKESLRITLSGQLAQTPHPRALGSTLTHPYITTDYSEALLELITPASSDPAAPLAWLDRLHRFVYHTLDAQDELIWNSSMPCPLGDDNDIPVANYGTSNVGRMKHIYRIGLGHRYGRRMQTIAGIHYNFSFPENFWALYQDMLQGKSENRQPLQDFISEHYFGLLRNFQRHVWLLVYLFGASPAVCANFLGDRPHQLLERMDHTLGRPFATSLRMSDLGYQNNAQSSLQVSLDNLESYVSTLTYAISTPEPAYQQIGVRDAHGNYRQLNPNILQIENEFYSSIRPKRVTQRNERPTLALQRRGVEYIEMRVLDLNPLLPVGIGQEDCRFLDIFATYCLLEPSPHLSHCDTNAAKQNMRQVVYDGRHPDLKLWRCNEIVTFKSWARELCDRMVGIAELFDTAYGGDSYQRSLAMQRAKIEDPSLTPSAQVLDAIQREQGLFNFAMRQARENREFFKEPPTPSDIAFFNQAATDSLAAQAVLEADTSTPFEAYLASYFQGLHTLTK